MRIDKGSPVAISRIAEYDVDGIERVIREHIERLGVSDMFAGKRVAIKPNLVMKKAPEAAATTHPAVLEAMIRVLKESAADIIIAESPGGLYTPQTLSSVYKVCGISAVAEKCGVKLNFDTGARDTEAPDGKTSKMFSVITPILDADVIVNLAKLKSHSLTGYSGAVKNYFGVVPGVTKFEMHARFPDYGDFGSMIADLCQMIQQQKPTFNLLDGILAMEGNGPTGGNARKMDCLISGTNPFTVDAIGSHIIGVNGVVMLEEGKARGFSPENISDVVLISDEPLESFAVSDFVKPDTKGGKGTASLLGKLPTMFGGRLNKWFQPRPVINTKTCVGCAECEKSCPQHTIEMRTDKKGKKQAYIIDSKCIKCYCCQELCPLKAVKIKKNPIIKLIGG